MSSLESGSARRSSTCFSIRLISPSTRAPRSLMLFRRAICLRRRNSASLGIAEEPEQAGQERPELPPLDDRVEVAVAEVGLGAAEVLADCASHRAAHEAEVHHRQLAGQPVERRPADDDRLSEPGRELGLREALAVRPEVEEVERIGGADVRRLLDEAGRVGELRDPLARRHGEVMAALAADEELELKLVLAVVR